MTAVRQLSPEEALRHRAELVDILVDAVEHGASVNFVQPMSRQKAERWWDGALVSHAKGERVILVAEADGALLGTVQLVPAPQENQPHRADVSKMLVLSRARRRGVGAALLRAVEEAARKMGRTLLTLDTEKDSAGELLYTAMGWTRFGEVPDFALSADGKQRQAASFFYKLLQPDRAATGD